MKKLILVTFASLFAAIGCAHAEAPAADAAAPKTGPFYNMYPSQLAPAAEAYFGEWNKTLFKEGPIETKAARLAAIAASAAMKCEYCITAQAMLGKAAGASDDEIKGATQIAAEISRFSVLLYGNEFGQDNLMAILKKMTQKPAPDAKPAAEAAASDAPKKSPFHKMYPAQLAPAAESYFGEWNKVLFKTGPIDSKTARLAAVAASAAMKCEYCITAQVVLAKAAGATDDEIKGAIQIAAEIGRFSILLYGNEFGQDKLKAILEKMTQKPA
ncbi:MAG: carboxymuconolactone decarboxylase family protein [Myxococcota bacterium]|nr:carboxymuconolactone decarboxylase family protein [Myxococcota bacterium]